MLIMYRTPREFFEHLEGYGPDVVKMNAASSSASVMTIDRQDLPLTIG